MKRLIHNRIQCKRCGKIIESHSRWDYASCDCPENPVAVDGGHDYQRIIGDMKFIKNMAEYKEVPESSITAAYKSPSRTEEREFWLSFYKEMEKRGFKW